MQAEEFIEVVSQSSVLFCGLPMRSIVSSRWKRKGLQNLRQGNVLVRNEGSVVARRAHNADGVFHKMRHSGGGAGSNVMACHGEVVSP